MRSRELKPGSITFFVPCLNEEGNIGTTLDRIVSAMKGQEGDYEVLVVDDASVDGTVQEVIDRQKIYPNVSINLVRNRFKRGLGRNYFLGAHAARGQYYMLICGDAAETVTSIQRILAHKGEADAVVPYFGLNESRTRARKMLSRTFSFLVSTLSGHNLRYYNGVVLHRTENVRMWFSETTGFGYQAELLCRLLDDGISVVEVEIENSDRNRGFSKAFALGNILSVANTLFHILLHRLQRITLGIFTPRSPKTQPTENHTLPSIGIKRSDSGQSRQR
jgi:dolichol-phosphate mannosyltransferase